MEVKEWPEGGEYRATTHAAGGSIVAGLGGGNALGRASVERSESRRAVVRSTGEAKIS